MERAPETTSKGINPATAFAVVAVVLLVIGLTWFFVRPNAAEPIPHTKATPPDFSLTNEEAIARVQELERLKLEAYRNQDASLLSMLFTDDSPSKQLVQKDFRKLRQSGITFQSEFETEDFEIQRNAGEEIVVRQTVRVTPHLVASDGSDVTKGRDQRQVVDWILRLEGDAWLVYETVVQEVKTLE